MPVVRPGWLASVTAAVVTFHALGEACAAEPPVTAVGRGRYLVAITGCNGCHTPGFALSGGKTTDQERLTGDALGWQGPWGTTYASNLRLFFQSMDEASWLKVARTREFRPPMPTPSIRAMSNEDLRALYRYVGSLGPSGAAMPAYLPPGQAPSGPAVVFPAPPPT